MLTKPPPHALSWRRNWSNWKLKLNFLNGFINRWNHLCVTRHMFNYLNFFWIIRDFHFVLQEIDELMKQIYSAHVSAQSALTVPDLATALKQIQTHYDDMAAKNLQVRWSHSSETWQRGVKCKHVWSVSSPICHRTWIHGIKPSLKIWPIRRQDM